MSQELIQHSRAGQSHIHRLTNWRFQDTASRNSVELNQFVAADVDKMCYDMETEKYYMLQAVHPSSGEPTWFEIPEVAPGIQGEVNTASNVGGGLGFYKEKVGVDLRFRTLVQGANTLITANANEITIAAVVPSIPDIPAQNVTVMKAATLLNAGRCVSINSDITKVGYTDPSNYASVRKVFGIVTAVAALDVDVSIKTQGMHTDAAWTWTPDQDIYVSGSGILTQSVPSSGYLIRAGIATSATSMLIRFEPAIAL